MPHFWYVFLHNFCICNCNHFERFIKWDLLEKEKKNEISPLPLEIFFSVFVKSWKLDFNFNNLFITAISSFLIQKEFLPVLFFVGKKKKSQYFQNVGLPKKKKNAVFNYVKWFICIPLMLLFFRIFLLLLIMLLAECGVMARMVSQIVESITKATFFLKKFLCLFNKEPTEVLIILILY